MSTSPDVATADVHIAATPERVWAALTDPGQIALWMDGARVATTWQVGNPITWTGSYDGHAYVDRGEVLVADAPRVLSMTHFSPLMGTEDSPENYHTLVYTLTARDASTHLSLTQDGCLDAAQAENFSANWQQMLECLKIHVEARTEPSWSSATT